MVDSHDHLIFPRVIPKVTSYFQGNAQGHLLFLRCYLPSPHISNAIPMITSYFKGDTHGHLIFPRWYLPWPHISRVIYMITWYSKVIPTITIHIKRDTHAHLLCPRVIPIITSYFQDDAIINICSNVYAFYHPVPTAFCSRWICRALTPDSI